jgi:hypothetical protein
MKLDEEFRRKLENSFKKNKEILLHQSIKQLEESFNTCYRVMIEPCTNIKYPYNIDLELSKKVILNSIKSEQNLSLRLKNKVKNKTSFNENEILFSLIKSDTYLAWDTEEGKNYRMYSQDLQYDCEKEFWRDQKKLNAYAKISNFKCEKEVELPSDIVYKSGSIDHYFINKAEWIDYVFKLSELNFPEFSFNQDFSTETTLRFLKPIADDYYWGFEYDIKFLNTSMKNGVINLPEYLNLMLINKKFKNNTQTFKYKYLVNELAISLGILGNPFFYWPCYQLDTFIHFDNWYVKGKYLNTINNYKFQHTKLSNGNIKISPDSTRDENIKKHAFFYMDILKYSSIGYLDFVEKSIIDTFKSFRR